MAKKLTFKTVLMTLAVLLVVIGASSCEKDILHPNTLNGDQLVAGRLDGTWGSPRDIVTPENVPAEVFGAMRLVFTTDANGNPSKFLAQDCPIVFGNGGEATWKVTGTEADAGVTLTGAGPVDDFKVKVTSETLVLSFQMGWENTETKATGKGNFQVTLARQ